MAHSAAPEAQAAPTLHPLHPLNALQPLHALHTHSTRSDGAAPFNQQAVHVHPPVCVAARKAAGRRADTKAAGRLEP